MIKCEPGDTIILKTQYWDRATGLYPQAKIYSGSTLVTTVNLTHVANGYYQNSYTVDGTYKQLIVQYLTYTDSGRTTLANIVDYATDSDVIYCNYDYRMPMGAVGGTTGLSKKDLELIAKLIFENEEFKKLKETIDKKSDFDPVKDTVKTNIQIPTINLREIKDSLSLIQDELKKPKKEKVIQRDYSDALKNIEKLIKSIPDNSDLLLRFNELEKIIKLNNPEDIPNLIVKSGVFNEIKGLIKTKSEFNPRRDIVKTDIQIPEIDLTLVEKSIEEAKNEISKNPTLIGKILRANLQTNENMLEALNVQEEKRHQVLKKILMSIIYAIQGIKNQPTDNNELLSGIQELIKQKNEATF
uniref:Uncharacterized protein n=1 Tax=viral metagenome TaxID=1070528 RepID=A0A6M3IS92_9ZZZZ